MIPLPPITRKTVELGVHYSPEFACLPLKVNVGNFIEELDKGQKLGDSGSRAEIWMTVSQGFQVALPLFYILLLYGIIDERNNETFKDFKDCYNEKPYSPD